MKLLDEIVEAATNSEISLADTLRKCLVLAYELDHDSLKSWVNDELNGYKDADDLPEYRSKTGQAKGLFVGPFGSKIENQPIPEAILEEKHRHWATDIKLQQPIAAYQDIKGDGMFPWPANLVMLYQSKFFDGNYALNRAWIEIPESVMTALVDTVRTRVLTFALQIRKELGQSNSINAIPKTKVDQIFNITIHGGTAIVGNVQNVDSKTVVAGDFGSLRDALINYGVAKQDVQELQTNLDEDGKIIGKQTRNWIATQAKKLVDAGTSATISAAREYIKFKLTEYFGIPPST